MCKVSISMRVEEEGEKEEEDQAAGRVAAYCHCNLTGQVEDNGEGDMNYEHCPAPDVHDWVREEKRKRERERERERK